MRVQAHFFDGYWEDVGTIAAYYQSNLDLCEEMPPFDFYDAKRPVYTHPRFLPPNKVEDCTLRRALVSEGCIVMGAEIERSIIGIRSRIGRGHTHPRQPDPRRRLLRVAQGDRRGAGEGPPARWASARTASSSAPSWTRTLGWAAACAWSTRAGSRDADGDGYYIRDGIVIIPKGGVVPDGTVI